MAGIGLGQAVNAFATGAQQGLDFMNTLDARRERREDRALAMVDRQRKLDREATLQKREDEAYKQQQDANFLAEQYARSKGGLDVDVEGLNKMGIQPSKHFSPEFKNWTDAVTELKAGKLDYNDPKFLKQLSWRLSDQIQKGVGTAVETNITGANGVAVPAGTKIESKEIAKLKAAQGGQMVAMLKMTGTTPDGKKIEWLNPATEGRSASPNANLLPINVEQIIDMAQGDELLSDAMGTKEWQKEIEARLVGLGRTLPVDEMAKEKLRADTDVKVAEIRAGATEKSARIRAGAIAAKGGAAGGKGGTEQQMIEYLKSNMFSDVADNKSRTKKAIEAYGKIKQLSQKSSGRQDFVAKLVADQMKAKVKGSNGKETMLWAGRERDLLGYVNGIADQVYGAPEQEAAAPTSDRADYVTDGGDDADIMAILGGE